MEGKKIYSAIADAMSEIKAIAKNGWNDKQQFYFRSIDDIMSDLNPILAKNRIFIYPEVLEQIREERKSKNGTDFIYSILKVKYHFCADDGSEICAVVIGEGFDTGDKASNKAIAVAFKYALLQVFCIPTDDLKDPDKDAIDFKNKHDNQKPIKKSEDPRRALWNLLLNEILAEKDKEGNLFFTKEEFEKAKLNACKTTNTVADLQQMIAEWESILNDRKNSF